MIFRWTIGETNTSINKPHSLPGFINFLYMAKMSILSFQRWFPSSKFVVLFNGNGSNYALKEMFNKARPALLKKVIFVDSSKYDNLYHFVPKNGVWWKWIPFRYKSDETELYVDTDVICLNRPTSFIEQIESNLDIVIMSEYTVYFSERVCGNFWNDPVLKNRIPVNCGLVVLKPEITLEKEFLEASKKVNYGTSPNSYFIDEQGSFNVALYKSDIPFSLLPRRENVYGHELLSRLDEGVDIEICHFIGRSKTVLENIQEELFIKIHDDLYTLEDMYNNLASPTRYLDITAEDIY